MSELCSHAIVNKRDGLTFNGQPFPFHVLDDVAVEGLASDEMTVVRIGVVVDGVVELRDWNGNHVKSLETRESIEARLEQRERRSVARYNAAIEEEQQKARRFLILTVIRVRSELGLDPSGFTAARGAA